MIFTNVIQIFSSLKALNRSQKSDSQDPSPNHLLNWFTSHSQIEVFSSNLTPCHKHEPLLQLQEAQYHPRLLEEYCKAMLR